MEGGGDFNGAAPARARNGAAAPGPSRRAANFNGAAPARARNEFTLDKRGRAKMNFNGAAPARARNASSPAWCLPSPTYFNGAAPARARNAQTVWVGPTPIPGLQRGRARAGAECFPMPAQPKGRGGLQRGRARAGAEWRMMSPRKSLIPMTSTGPRPRGRGMRAAHACKGRTPELQRGRARAGAECLFASVNTGALAVLQRGRARAGAECIPCRGGWQIVTHTSTGPRPRGRGMDAEDMGGR